MYTLHSIELDGKQPKPGRGSRHEAPTHGDTPQPQLYLHSMVTLKAHKAYTSAPYDARVLPATQSTDQDDPRFVSREASNTHAHQGRRDGPDLFLPNPGDSEV